MTELYRDIHILSVTRDQIIIDHTESRLFLLDATLAGIFWPVILFQTLGYNRLDWVEICVTLAIFLFLLLIQLFKTRIWMKKIVFDRASGTVRYISNVTRKDKAFNFSGIHVDAVMKRTEYSSSQNFIDKRERWYYLQEKYGSGKKLSIGTAHVDYGNFMNFIEGYMNSDEQVMAELILYERAFDFELHEVVSI